MSRRHTAAERAEFLAEVRAGGSMAEAASRHGVTPSTGYLWLKQSRSGQGSASSSGKKVVFARALRSAPPSSATEVCVQVGSASVRVQRGFDAELLRAVVAALGGAEV